MIRAAGFFILASFATSVCAQSLKAEDFYRQQPKLTLGVPAGAGGTYDTYTRLLARFLPRYMPGNVAVIVQNIPAAGGLVLTNQTFNSAPKDGSYMAMVRGSSIQEHVNGNPAALFDGRAFAWIGNMNMEYESCLVRSDGPVQKLSDLYERELIIGASGAGSQSVSFPLVYNAVLGMKFKIVSGYDSTPLRVLAMERGEVMGNCGVNTSAIQATFPEQYKSGKVRVLLQAAMKSDPRFSDAPNILAEARRPEDRQALEYMFSTLELGRPFAVPPETPADRVNLLRWAFEKALADPELRSEAVRLQLDLVSMNHFETLASVVRLYETPRSVVERVQAILNASGR